MGRRFDVAFANKLKNYIKTEWMVNGQKPISRTVGNITESLFGEVNTSHKNQVWRYLLKLERGGSIKIIRIEGGGGPGNPNSYEWVSDQVNEELFNIKEEYNETIEECLAENTNAIQKFMSMYANQTQKLIAVTGELEQYKEALRSLELFGPGQDGRQIFLSSQEINSVVEQVKKEYEVKAKREEEKEKAEFEGFQK